MHIKHLEKPVIALFLVLITGFLVYSDTLWRFDRWIYDTQLKLFASPPSDEIVIIEVDEKSLTEIGRWPWSRSIHAELLDALLESKSLAIALNFIISEPDLNHPKDDNALAKALAKSQNIALPIIIEQNEQAVVEILPIPALEEYAILGHANVQIDKDGSSRSVYLKIGKKNSSWPSLALALYAMKHPDILDNLPGIKTHLHPDVPEQQIINNNQVWLPFFKPDSDFSRVSYIDVLLGHFKPDYFSGKYVLVGLTASGLDQHITSPLNLRSRPMMGVDFIASILDGLIKKKLWQPLSQIGQFIISIIIVGIAIQIYRYHSINKVLILSCLLLVCSIAFSIILLNLSDFWFSPAVSLFVIIISYPLWSWRQIESTIQLLFAEKKRALVTLNSIADGVITVKNDGCIDYINDAALTMIKALEDEIKGFHIDKVSIQLPAQTNGLFTEIERCVKNKERLYYTQCLLLKPDDSSTIVNLSISPLTNKNDAISGSVLTFTNVTKLVEMTDKLVQTAKEQAELTLQKEKAEYANQAKSHFLSIMTHELRTPLNAIIGYSQLLQMDEDMLTKDHLESIDEILLASYHLLDLINELLDLAKIESGNIDINIQEINVGKLLEECLSLISPMASKHKIKIIFESKSFVTNKILGDQKRVKQILLNFMSNAIKYNKKEGTVTVHTLQSKPDKLQILITDTGNGLTEQQQESVFNSFERLGANKSEIEGTGLGLSITKQFAELMGGQVGVKSTVGVGSSFWLELKMLDDNIGSS